MIVQLRPIYVTFFTAFCFVDKVLDELARHLPEEHERRALIRVAGLPIPPNPFDVNTEPWRLAFIDKYKSLCASEPIASASGSEHVYAYEAILAPQLVILDFFIYQAMGAIRAISGTSVPIYAWEIKGELLELPGIPPMYDYEFGAQILADDINLALHSQYCHRMFSECDGIIHSSNRAYEGPALDVLQEWFGSRPTFATGPLCTPADAASLAREKAQSPVASEVEVFLHSALDKFGPNSVVYFSFGTVCWCIEPEKIWTILDVLMELGIPFVFSHASPAAIIPEEMKAKVKASGLGFLAPWLPQEEILHHAACGWFLTHCGQNSVMEAFVEGVPLICWPFDADEPVNAANISVTLDVGYELMEVRNGPGKGPIHRLGGRTPEGTVDAVRREAIEVFTKARGEDGRVKRANVQRLREIFAHHWEEGGAGWTELKRLTDILH
ncbi:hypothetical protein EW145_g231 [Phellinidium pouzarii]|uniref:UDP-glycosyltransferases domain-containing protein n=1 Tax=Phellinidium pouzarii TaxID=167371 RepID=A0A4S4LL34_9AGAM|nr:hypothetical protein EW145_g231 [Phellinidium pouzarii]